MRQKIYLNKYCTKISKIKMYIYSVNKTCFSVKKSLLDCSQDVFFNLELMASFLFACRLVAGAAAGLWSTDGGDRDLRQGLSGL